jgi:ferredoxin-like protein FixX
MEDSHPTKSPLLNDNGLNMQAVFNLSELPEEITSLIRCDPDTTRFKQLIIFAHGGRRMWESVQASRFTDADEPIDSFSIDLVRRYFSETCSENTFEVLYPGSKQVVPLQKLGRLAGWHHDSPFRIGVNLVWGSWFAYRVAVLADTEFEATLLFTAASPCLSCTDKPCLSACPAEALECGDFSLKLCIDYRLREHSQCKAQCLARLACPVGCEHRYSMEQINYHYARSMQTIEEYNR